MKTWTFLAVRYVPQGVSNSGKVIGKGLKKQSPGRSERCDNCSQGEKNWNYVPNLKFFQYNNPNRK